MKRSEVLKLIEELFNLELDLYPKHNPTEIFAENLLCHLEETIGMLPPETTEKIADNDYGCIEEGYKNMTVNKWEDE